MTFSIYKTNTLSMNKSRFIALLLLTLPFISCSSSDDDETTTVVQQAPDYPEQLLQLNEAHEKKLISDSDYQAQLKKINKAMNK